jgi:hypothetical protein
MKKMLLTALIIGSSVAYSQELTTFQEVADAASQGKRITFVVHLKQCTSEMPVPSSIVAVTPNALMVINNNRVTASDRHFTLDNPMSRGTPTFDYTKFNLDSEGGVSIKTSVLNANNYEKLGSYQFNCDLGTGFRVYA